jgi:hypothetical protein
MWVWRGGGGRDCATPPGAGIRLGNIDPLLNNVFNAPKTSDMVHAWPACSHSFAPPPSPPPKVRPSREHNSLLVCLLFNHGFGLCLCAK